MAQRQVPTIQRLVEHHGGPTAVSRKLGGKPVYQEVQRWASRGWASPKHIFRLEPLLPPGVTVRDLYSDIDAAKATEREVADQPKTDAGEQERAVARNFARDAAQAVIDTFVRPTSRVITDDRDKPSKPKSERR